MDPPHSQARVNNDLLTGRSVLQPRVTAGKNDCVIHVQGSMLCEINSPSVRECLGYCTLAKQGTFNGTFHS